MKEIAVASYLEFVTQLPIVAVLGTVKRACYENCLWISVYAGALDSELDFCRGWKSVTFRRHC